MNVHAPDIDRHPTEEEAQAALAVLRRYADSGQTPKVGLYPDLLRTYPDLTVDAAYRDTLPDLQNGPASLIRGEDRAIQHVGISNFRLPMQVGTRSGPHLAEVSVTGTVSLEAGKKGINMSRIMRSFYRHAERLVGFDVVEAALDDYLADLDSFDARLLLRFSLPLQVESLRSGLTGWQYYDISMEVVQTGQTRRRVLHLDYVYSSTCPCSLELSEHARQTRNQLATPHSQRSVARLSVEVTGDLGIEDVIEMCRAQVPTETQVMVKREDEQAFAELNAANPIFVEDAARLFAEGLTALPGVGDYRVVASHQESLHSHDAVSVLTQGDLFAADTLEPRLFGTLVHPG
ncbi:GTP cyclohydrolase FolE2 [Jannaschia pagri]|uniref:GTP cyclohydrolase FolE2 n=1 Tax=Jannaschia pagri TaxID=2829797 RepID=A0ABQ4NHJ1_9RHOB|nr:MULTISPECIES: GTP cyclohydrolase FolE2 [unclassified Jannaschia]GIT90342.1 GTP cyclohydrolase FolE2 [Jannaschia sp. AI_61]GIT93552.1 GTP cyclohydrolase FolE2 [Jannaschia sp. AI_62]